MSPILVRPVREQLEHDRVIRLLQAEYKRKFDVGINLGQERSAPAGPGSAPEYPDLVLHSSQRGRKLMGVVEVETTESVNHLEALSQWVAFARLRAPFHLYVPTGSVDPARRMCLDMGVPVAELWAYHLLGDQMRFTLVQRSGRASRARPAGATARKAPASARARKSTAGRKTTGAKATKTKSARTARTTRKAAKTAGRAAKKAVRKTAAKPKAAKKTTRSRSR